VGKIAELIEETKDNWSLFDKKPFWYKVKKVAYYSTPFQKIKAPFGAIRSFVSKVIRVCQFVPVIWKTHDWDYNSMLELWAYSYRRLQKECVEEGRHVTTKNFKKRSRAVLYLFDRLTKDSYMEPHRDYFDKKWGKPEFEFVKSETSRHYSLVDKNKKRLSDKEKEKYRQGLKALFKKEDDLFNQDLDLLFKIVKKDIKRWWD
jgi:hypothetical protein